jgi:hypothetical protein
MQKYFVVALALGAGLAAAAVSGSVSAKPASYDGTWTVRLVTQSGTCENSYSQTVAVENGQVRGAGDGAAISGGVGQNGEVALTIRRSIAQGAVSGRLNGRSGSGNWSVAMLGCTGRWTASRA